MVSRMTNLYDFTLNAVDGQPKPLSDFRGQVLLVVNVASRCGLTPQYTALEALHREYGEEGFSVLGFPCNDFAGQEPASESEIQTFCSTQYDVTFPLFSKVKVLGEQKTPLYAFLTTQETSPDGPGEVSWNFAKFLINKRGEVVARFGPKTAPNAPEIEEAIERALNQD